MLKKILAIAPKLESDESYAPSKLALKIATSDTTDFENIAYTKYQGPRPKILVLCTEEKNLKIENYFPQAIILWKHFCLCYT